MRQRWAAYRRRKAPGLDDVLAITPTAKECWRGLQRKMFSTGTHQGDSRPAPALPKTQAHADTVLLLREQARFGAASSRSVSPLQLHAGYSRSHWREQHYHL